MKKKAIKGLDVSLSVSILKQGDCFIAYTPALDISTYGRSLEEAKKNFQELVDVFFAEFDDERSLANVLESLGWTKQKAAWTPPVEVEHTHKSFTVPSFA